MPTRQCRSFSVGPFSSLPHLCLPTSFQSPHVLLLLMTALSLACHLALCTCLLLGLASGQSTKQFDVNPDPTARIVLLSDSHVIQPQEDLEERGSNQVDRSSVLKSHQRLWQTVTTKINAIEPAPKLAVFGGDLVHDGFLYGRNASTLLHSPGNVGFHNARAILDELRLPLAMALGNHDYQVKCGNPEESTPRHVSSVVFRTFFDADPYYAVNMGGWRLLLLNSQLGDTWDAEHPACNTKVSSYGKKQLQWAARQLRGGRPTVVFIHFPLPASAANEVPGWRWPDLASLLAAHPNVKLVVSGHFHRGYNWQDLYSFPHITLPAVRFDSDNFFLLDLHRNGTYSMPDWPKNKGGSRCSDPWRYEGTVSPGGTAVPGKKDCGWPVFNETDDFRLPPVESQGDLPKNFNPEQTCSFAMARQVLAPCLRHGSTSQCCAIMAANFGPRASLLFTGCFCQPSFWQACEEAFAATGQSLASVIETCIDRSETTIFYRGAGACPAPKDATSWQPGTSARLSLPSGNLAGRKGMTGSSFGPYDI